MRKETIMDETVTKKGISTGMAVVIAVVVAIVFGGGAYAYVNNKAEKEKNDLNAKITELQSQVSSATAGWKTYTDSSVGFTFKYPSNASLSVGKGDRGSVFSVDINNLNTMKDGPLGYDKANALRDKTALVSGDPSTSFGQAGPATLKMLSIKNALAKELTIFAQIEVCSVRFDRQAIIYKDDYQIILSWEYAGTDIQNNNPSYFKTDSENCGSQKIWGSSMASSIYTDLVAGKTDAVSQNWFTDFDKIIPTFQFTK